MRLTGLGNGGKEGAYILDTDLGFRVMQQEDQVLPSMSPLCSHQQWLRDFTSGVVWIKLESQWWSTCEFNIQWQCIWKIPKEHKCFFGNRCAVCFYMSS